MSIKKFLIVILSLLSVITMLSISIFAEEVDENAFPTGMGFENEVDLSPDKHFSMTSYNNLESGTSHASDRSEFLPKLFDKNTVSAGFYTAGDSWFGSVGDYIMITFNEVTPITSMHMYLAGNWTSANVYFIDENGETIRTIDEVYANNSDTTSKHMFFEAASTEEAIPVKQIKIEVVSIKWNDVFTYKIYEICLFGLHEHNYINPGDPIVPETCATPGLREMLCSCGEVSEAIVPPSGSHNIEEEDARIFFRDGFTGVGYLYSSYCTTCDTQDVQTDIEVGPLFVSLGYSVREFDVESGYAIQYGFGVNYENIQYYKELSQIDDEDFDFGIIAASKVVCGENNPLKLSGGKVTATANGIVCKSYTESGFSGYSIYSYFISGFTDPDVEFVLSAYVYDGWDIYYLANETTTASTTVSYKTITAVAE